MTETLPFLPYLLQYQEKVLFLPTIKKVEKPCPFGVNFLSFLNNVRRIDFSTIAIFFLIHIVLCHRNLRYCLKNTIEDFPLKTLFESLTAGTVRLSRFIPKAGAIVFNAKMKINSISIPYFSLE